MIAPAGLRRTRPRAGAVAVVALIGIARLGALAQRAHAGLIEVEPSTVDDDRFFGDSKSPTAY